MKNTTLNRRRFLRETGFACAGSAFLAAAPMGCGTKKTNWEIGCFNRPWDAFSYDDALEGLSSLGFATTGLVGGQKQNPEPLLRTDATPDYLDKLRGRIAAKGLKPLTAWIPGPKSREHAAMVSELKILIDHAAQLKLPWLLSGGPRRNETVEDYTKAMAAVMPYAAEKGLKIAMKPHGGDGPEVLECLERVNHDSFSIWYDAGNMIYYTGEDPVASLKPLASHVTGFCAKDCAEKGSSVTIQFGEGSVDFVGVFSVLNKAGFNGPVMIECAGKADTAEQATRNVAQNRDYLKNVFTQL